MPEPLLTSALAVVALIAGVAAVAALVRWRRHRRSVAELSAALNAVARSESGRERLEPVEDDLLDGLVAAFNRLLDRQAAERIGAEAGERALLVRWLAAQPEVSFAHTDVIVGANVPAADQLETTPAELEGRDAAELVRPPYRALFRKRVKRLLEGDDVGDRVEVQLANGRGQAPWAELTSRVVEIGGQRTIVTVARDISYRKSMELALKRGKAQARYTLESIGEGVITTGNEGVIDYMNEAAETLIGVPRGQAVGKRLEDLATLVDEVDRKSLGDPVARCLAEKRRVNLGRRALMLTKAGGREASVELTASPIRGPAGELAGCVVIFHDVSELRGLTRQMSYQASHDALTGLLNRREFEHRVEDALSSARSEDVTHVLCYLDLDRFKAVNDTCGHIAGDNMLREIAALIKEEVRDSDSVARLGGDEFGMLLVGCPLDKARQIADDICTAIANYRFVWQDKIFNVGVSIGLVQMGHESGGLEDVLGAADSACYVAKQQGRGRVHVYSARDEALARQRGEIQWLQKIQAALKENRFELYTQPIISLGGRVEEGPAVEVLLRLRDEHNTRISPLHFLAAAERYHLMSHIDRWVVQTALAALGSGALRLPDKRSCSINLSGQTMGDEGFLEFVVDCLDHTGVNPGQVCFEVPEASIVGNLEHARRFISVLHGMGCRFAIDDFGNALGSFSNLKTLSLDYLKIDGSFTRDLTTDTVHQAMVASLVKLSKTLDFRVVAEQVEDQEAFEAVRRMGVDFAQGYVVERPQPLNPLH
jgi:diguanylate cyclase (GGDEF)-like protein/PAS domain S-box-containing protein